MRVEPAGVGLRRRSQSLLRSPWTLAKQYRTNAVRSSAFPRPSLQGTRMKRAKWLESTTVTSAFASRVSSATCARAAAAPCQDAAPRAGSHATVRFSLTRGRAPPETRRSASESGASAIRMRSLDKRNTVDLFQGGFTVLHGCERGVAQEAGAACPGGFLELAHRGTGGDQLAQLVVEDHQFGDRLASLVAGAAAFAAAAPGAEAERGRLRFGEAGLLEQGRIGPAVLAAVRADEPHQALRQDRVQCGNKAEQIDVHVHETADHVEYIVRVDGGENEVPRERGLHGDVGRLRVAYLANHDLVGIVPQDGAQPPRESEPLFLVDRDLQDARELVFHRVLDRDDLVLAVVDLRDGGVQRGGLAAAGGPGDQQHPVGLVRQAPQRPDVVRLEPEAVQRELLLSALVKRLLVEHPQHRVLAVDVGHDRNAEIDSAPAVERLETPVLGDAPLCDVELGENLHAGDGLLGLLGVLDELDLREDAVDAELDHQPRGDRFHVNVARAYHQRVAQGGAHQPHDLARLLADRLEREILDAARLVAGDDDPGAHRVERPQSLLVACEKRHEVAAVHQAPGELLGDAFFRPGLLLSGEGVVGHEPQRAGLAAHEGAAALGALAEGQHVEGRRRTAQLFHAHDLNPERRAEPRYERVRVQAELRLEDFDEPPARGGCR